MSRFLLLSSLLFFTIVHAYAQSPLFAEIDEFPRFPGCEELEGDHHAKKRCADQELLKFIYSNIQYPQLAKENKIEGMAVVSFLVTQQGTIRDIHVLRDPGGGLGAEAKRVVELMLELPEPWTAGRKDGEAVAVKYNLPIRFKWDLDEPKKKEKKKNRLSRS